MNTMSRLYYLYEKKETEISTKLLNIRATV